MNPPTIGRDRFPASGPTRSILREDLRRYGRVVSLVQERRFGEARRTAIEIATDHIRHQALKLANFSNPL